MSEPLEKPDTIHVSPWLVKILASAILGGLGLIGLYMISWNVEDGRFKERVLLSLDSLERQAIETREIIKIVPTNTQKLADHERRIDRVEAYHESRRE